MQKHRHSSMYLATTRTGMDHIGRMDIPFRRNRAVQPVLELRVCVREWRTLQSQPNPEPNSQSIHKPLWPRPSWSWRVVIASMSAKQTAL
ncbi:Uncharacterized protein HZ326_18962 [Fusarium oxysporum f. sp. albedinis]|nr:Uncharacterized protein HZ326_18962 [Fusarium oxysporum f. sp. albedinis]